ncbi:MAG: M56 family metallopeptidase [Eubacteriales bacterium]|nr:M56 family metallopeptidase [Eubacteriales bacterium]
MNKICEIFLTVCNMSLTASAVILLVILTRYALRKLPRSFSYYLWAIVGFRLICPYSLPSIFSIFNLKIFREHAGSGSQIIWASSEALERQGKLSASTGEMLAEASTDAVETANLETVAETAETSDSAATSLTQTLTAPGSWSLLDVLAVIWILGLLTFLIYQIVSYHKLYKKVEMAVQFQKDVYECDTIQVPFVMGFIRPRIYFPFRMTEKERSYVLFHEQYHIKRHDYQVKGAASILLAVHWFNPLVWLAYYLMCKDMEMSCDEKVIRAMGQEIKEDYSRSLLNFASRHRSWAMSPLAFGDVPVKARIKNVLNFRNPKRIAVILGIVLCAFAVVIGVGNGKRGNSIRNITAQDGDDGTKITYEYELTDEINSCLVYKEWYENGILTKYQILDARNLDSNQKKGTLTLERQPFLYTDNYEWDSKMTFHFPDTVHTRTDYLSLLEAGYIGVADTYYLKNDTGWQNLEKESDIVLAAWNLAGSNKNGQVEGIPCQDYMQEPSKTEAVSRNDGVILYHICFSPKDVKQLRKEYAVSPYAQNLLTLSNPYVGDAPADGELIQALAIAPKIPRTLELKTDDKPYALILHFKEAPEQEFVFYQEMLKKSTALLTFIENLDQVEWTYSIEAKGSERRFCLTREQAEKLLDVESLDKFTDSAENLQMYLEQYLPYAQTYYETIVDSIAPTGIQYFYSSFIIGKLPGSEYDSVFRVLTNEDPVGIQDVAEALESWGSSDNLYVVKEISRAAAMEERRKIESGGYLAYDGNVYQHRMIFTGRHPNAVKDTTYLVYSNREKTTFDDVTDYFFGSLESGKDMFVLAMPSYAPEEENE